jgi:glutathione S-transferase
MNAALFAQHFAATSAVTAVALVQFLVFGALVAKSRVRHNVPAPAMHGPAEFERLLRVHANTMERMMVFLPLFWLSSALWRTDITAAVGLLFVASRHMYWRGYVAEPSRRKLGNVLTMVAMAVLLLAVVANLVRYAAA